MIPEDMKSELQAWNNGAGISLENWIGCEGNVKLAVGYSTFFWPKFKVLDDYVVGEMCSLENLKALNFNVKATKNLLKQC